MTGAVPELACAGNVGEHDIPWVTDDEGMYERPMPAMPPLVVALQAQWNRNQPNEGDAKHPYCIKPLSKLHNALVKAEMATNGHQACNVSFKLATSSNATGESVELEFLREA